MKYQFTRNLPILLAAALQVMPLLRSLFINPATGSTMAFVLRWGIGLGATVGAADAVSGATSTFTTPSTFSGSVGTPFTNNVSVSISGGNTAASSDYFTLANGGTTSPLIMNNQTTTLTLPPGLTFKASWVNNASTIGGVIYGIPTTSGSYPTTITVVSPGNASLSQNVTITIGGSAVTAPSITAQPVATTNVVAGKNVAFTVTAAGTPLNYFWRQSGAVITNGAKFAGVNSATLIVSNAAAADAANYSVIITNSAGSVTSSIAALSIILPPSISAQPIATTNAVGSNAVFSVTATGASLAYKWLKNSAVIADTTKYIGTNSASLTVSNLVAATDGGNYSVIITNLAGSVTSSVAALTVAAPPSISAPPTNALVPAGGSVVFTVTAAGFAPLTYQWLKNSAPISGATNSSLPLAAVGAGDNGNYSVLVSNLVGNASASAALVVQVPPAVSQVGRNPNGSFTLQLSGMSNSNYIVQVSSDLINWTPLVTNTLPASGTTQVTDTNAATQVQRFYRLVKP
jgi:hypothetical protein